MATWPWTSSSGRLLVLATVSLIHLLTFIHVESQVLTKTESYRILELPLGASWDEVKTQYHSLLIRHHPDRNRQTKEMEKAATEKTQQIIAAYETLQAFFFPETDEGERVTVQPSTTTRRQYYGFNPNWYGGDCITHGWNCLHGHCVHNFLCECYEGWIGVHCNIPDDDPCASSPCEHGGSCYLDYRREFFCICTAGYMQPTCSQECRYPTFGLECKHRCIHCTKHHCHHEKGCKRCLKGFISLFANSCDRLDCMYGRSPCKNLGICNQAGEKCQCRSQFTGAFCETFIEPDFNENFLPCGLDEHFKDCKNNGVCVLPRWSQGTAVSKCICKAEFFGEFCEKRCASKVPGVCDNGYCEFHMYLGQDTPQIACDCWDGYSGIKCDKQCTSGWYGRDCDYNCDINHCLYRPCFYDTGFCPGGACEEKWYGLRCDHGRLEFREKVNIRMTLSFEEESHDLQEDESHDSEKGPQVRVPYEKLLDLDSDESKHLVMRFMSWMDEALSTAKIKMNLRDIIITWKNGDFNITEEEERKRRQADVTSPLGIQCTIEIPTSPKNASMERRRVWAQMKAEVDQFEFEGLVINEDSIQLSKAKLTTFAADDSSRLKNKSKTNLLISQLRAGIITAFVLTTVITIVAAVFYKKTTKKRGTKEARPCPYTKASSARYANNIELRKMHSVRV